MQAVIAVRAFEDLSNSSIFSFLDFRIDLLMKRRIISKYDMILFIGEKNT